MLQTLRNRLETLEEKLNPSGVVVIAWDGIEGRDECIRRVGADRRTVFILADATDQRA